MPPLQGSLERLSRFQGDCNHPVVSRPGLCMPALRELQQVEDNALGLVIGSRPHTVKHLFAKGLQPQLDGSIDTHVCTRHSSSTRRVYRTAMLSGGPSTASLGHYSAVRHYRRSRARLLSTKPKDTLPSCSKSLISAELYALARIFSGKHLQRLACVQSVWCL